MKLFYIKCEYFKFKIESFSRLIIKECRCVCLIPYSVHLSMENLVGDNDKLA